MGCGFAMVVRMVVGDDGRGAVWEGDGLCMNGWRFLDWTLGVSVFDCQGTLMVAGWRSPAPTGFPGGLWRATVKSSFRWWTATNASLPGLPR